MGASTYDEICINCGATDEVPGGWGRLALPCPNAPPMTIILRAAYRYECPTDPEHARFHVTAEGAKLVDDAALRCAKCGKSLCKTPLDPRDPYRDAMRYLSTELRTVADDVQKYLSSPAPVTAEFVESTRLRLLAISKEVGARVGAATIDPKSDQ